MQVGFVNEVEDINGNDQRFFTCRSHMLHCSFSSTRVYVVRFNNGESPAYRIPSQIVDRYGPLIEYMLSGDHKRIGETTKDGIILRLQSAVGSHEGRLIVFPQKHVLSVLARLSPANPLTDSEQRVAMQLVCGYSLKEAARVHGVSYETRRAQLKAILSKSKLKRQADLCNFIIVQLLSEIENEETVEFDQIRDAGFENYIRTFLPNHVRSHTAIAEDGRRHRFIEMGPDNGRSVLVLHGHYIPYLTQSAIDILISHRLRLIWCLRNGMLGPGDRILSFEQHIDHATRSIEIARELFSPARRAVPVVAVGCAAQYAIAHAEKHDSTAEQYIFIGASTCQARKLLTVNLSGDFGASVSNVNSMLANYLISLAARPLIDSSHLKKLLSNAYSTSVPDHNLIEVEFSNKHRREALKYQYENASDSVKHDCSYYITPDWPIVRTIQQPVRFIHGTHDGINKIEDVKHIAADLGASVDCVSRAGQLVFHSHFKNCLSLIAKVAGRVGRGNLSASVS